MKPRSSPSTSSKEEMACRLAEEIGLASDGALEQVARDRRTLRPYRRSATELARELGASARAGFSRRVLEAVLASADIEAVEALAAKGSTERVRRAGVALSTDPTRYCRRARPMR